MTLLTVIGPGCGDMAGKIASGLDACGAEGEKYLIRSVESAVAAAGAKHDVLVLSPEMGTAPGAAPRVACKILLMPGDAEAEGYDAGCIVTYGMSPKDTVTLSSIGEDECVLAIQRELVTARGDVLERQELRIAGGMRPDSLMAITGALLLLGCSPESLSAETA